MVMLNDKCNFSMLRVQRPLGSDRQRMATGTVYSEED
jgi:hypothetical protein